MKITIFKCDIQATPAGKELKKLGLMVEGKKFPMENVTAWSDTAPDYAKLDIGYVLEADLDEKPSKTMNPKSGKPYTNRTLIPLQNSNGTIANSTPVEARVTKLELQMKGVLEELNLTPVKPIQTDEPEDEIPF